MRVRRSRAIRSSLLRPRPGAGRGKSACRPDRPERPARSRREERKGPAPPDSPANASPPANADASGVYGPDDPAYGPPRPGWSHQDRPIADVPGAGHPAGVEPVGAAESGRAPAKAEQIAAEPDRLEHFNAEQLAAEQVRPVQSTAGPAQPEQLATTPAATDKPAVRGPFEPLVEHDRQPSASAADHPATDADGGPYEFPGSPTTIRLDRRTPRSTGSRSCT